MARVGVGSVRFVAASLAVVFAASATAGCCSLARKLTGGRGKPTPPALDPETELYTDARARFTSKLRTHGPAPQKAEEDRPALASDAAEFTYPSGGLTLRAWVSRDLLATPAPARRPGVVFLHGGFAFGAEDWAMTAPYREAGYAVIVPLLRGENGQPGEFSAFYNEVDDVLASTVAFTALPGVDPGRVFVAGHSVGGTLAMLAALAAPFYRAGASFSGSPDQRAFLEDAADITPFDPSDPREYVVRSPVAYATSFRCPFRLYYGSDEEFFPKFSDETVRRARAAGGDVEVAALPGDHMSALAAEISQSIAFFRSLSAAQRPDAGNPVP